MLSGNERTFCNASWHMLPPMFPCCGGLSDLLPASRCRPNLNHEFGRWARAQGEPHSSLAYELKNSERSR